MKKIYILLIAAIITSSAFAQDLRQRRNELSISAAGGLSSLQYDLSVGEHKIGFGGQAGVGYSFFFSPYWSLGTGAEIALYQAKSTFSGFWDSYELNGYKETQQAWYVNIPLMAQYQTGGRQKFFVAFGGKVGFPVKATAETKDYSITMSEYLPTDRTYSYTGGKTDLDKLDLNLMASAELGTKWKISGKNALYTGVYADYGFNNIQKTNDKIFITNASSGVNSPMVESQFYGKPFTDKITPLAAGVKIRFAFGCGKSFRRISVRMPVVEEVIIGEVSAEPPFVDTYGDEDAAERELIRLVAEEKAKQAEAARRQAIIDEIQRPVERYGLSVSTLNAMQKEKLDDKIELLKENPDIEVFIHGHTCEIGGDAANERVGKQRAERAKAYMISKGVPERRILGTASRRDTEPLVPNTSEENRRINRRVEVLVR